MLVSMGLFMGFVTNSPPSRYQAIVSGGVFPGSIYVHLAVEAPKYLCLQLESPELPRGPSHTTALNYCTSLNHSGMF
jgi:hypothetical protein